MVLEVDYPRCATCRFWRGDESSAWGSCEVRGKNNANASLIDTDDPFIAIVTHETFGCVAHETRAASETPATPDSC